MGVIWRYRFLKMALLFYLVPVPELKFQFYTLLQEIFGYQNIKMEENVPQILVRSNSILVGPAGQIVLPGISKRVMIAALLIACCSLAIIITQIYRYSKVKRVLIQCGSESGPSERVTRLFNKVKREIKLDRTVKLVLSAQIGEPMAVGMIFPVILLPDQFADWEEENLYYIFKHELIHIKNWDLGFKFIGLIVMAVHWFNPFCILLCRELSDVAELCCDKQVIAGNDESDVRRYGILLIDMAAVNGRNAKHRILLSAKLIGSETKRMKRRIKEMKKKEHINRILVSFILVMVFQVAFATAVFAYNPLPKMEVANVGLDQGKVQEVFFPGDVKQDIIEDLTKGGVVFVEDKTGVVYKIDGTKTKAFCNHNYVSGTTQVHVKKSDGGCRVDYYYSQRCSNFGYVKLGDKYNSLTYDVCPH